MSKGIVDRSWLSPFVAVSFLVVAATGTVLLFHGQHFSVMVLHEFMSVPFCIAGLLHTWLNWKPFIRHFRQRRAFVSLAIGVFLSSLLVSLALAHATQHEREGADAAPRSDLHPHTSSDPR